MEHGAELALERDVSIVFSRAGFMTELFRFSFSFVFGRMTDHFV
jgi:hypothetical protein